MYNISTDLIMLVQKNRTKRADKYIINIKTDIENKQILRVIRIMHRTERKKIINHVCSIKISINKDK